jgi:hypothetical protein
MTIALVLAAMTILDWITVYTAAKVYLVCVGISYLIMLFAKLKEDGY